MPTNTFFNLSKEKKEKILESAKEEFSNFGFYHSSINRIIKEANIPRGSFYQYFENKEDLYFYLLNSITNLHMQAIINKSKEHKYDIFELQLFLFDYITVEAVKSKDKDFIIAAVSNMDMKLGNHLMKITNENSTSVMLTSMVSTKLSEPEEYVALFNLLIMSLTNELVCYFNHIKTIDACRQSLRSTTKLIQHGVLKNKGD